MGTVTIQEYLEKLRELKLIKGILLDRTTRTNILWGTDAYSDLGSEYQRDKRILAKLITGKNIGVIKSRAEKSREQQLSRTRQHAEVFTPVWVCNKMNNHIDEIWFGKPDTFNRDGVPTERVEFPEKEGKQGKLAWQQYVDSKRMEITCGEAPYLVSRYDVATGEEIPIKNRIGILDRKLRVVNENTRTEKEWLKWAKRAFQATYGYEFQGDNLLIARLNLLQTFEEYLWERWWREPTKKEYQELIKFITWNIWQMDGLTGAIPYLRAEEEQPQLTLFEVPCEEIDRQPKCRIFDWRSDHSLEYLSLGEQKKRGKEME